MADKLNTAKHYFVITDCWHVHYKHGKTFQSSLSHYDGVDKEKHIAVIALHKCGIESACIFGLLKLIILCVFLCIELLFLDMRGVNDHKRSSRPCMVPTPQVIMLLGQELTEILSKNKKSWLRKWILCQEPWVALSNKTWGFQMTNRTMSYRCIKRK